MCCVGQYTGMSKPMIDYHTKISSFNDTVSFIMSTSPTSMLPCLRALKVHNTVIILQLLILKSNSIFLFNYVIIHIY